MNTSLNRVERWSRRAAAWPAIVLALGAIPAHAQETICARVKIEVKQELTLERQAFDAEMRINNALDNTSLTEVSVVVKVTDEQGVPVPITSDPNNVTAKFFLRVTSLDKISDVTGTGSVAPASTATINWLLIPAPGSAGANPFGKKYLVGATLQYTFGAETHTLEVSPDVITVKPLPLLTLDYFLTRDVIADDPITPEVEPVEPFTLGVRVTNTGMATAKALKIDSAQPRIVQNDQGLLINFRLTGSYVDDAPVQNTLLVDFGDIPPATARMGRWVMETSLSGRFTEFTANFSHSDELGGMLTSIMQATNAHLLIRDVRVDLPGRDFVRDFLGQDVIGGDIKVYESDGSDTLVADRSTSTVLTVESTQGDTAIYQMSLPATAGFVYAKKADPFSGQKALGQVIRSDGKTLLSENVWLSKSKNPNTNTWEYWVSLFDANTPGGYTTEFVPPPEQELAPVIQAVADRVVVEDNALSFIVEATSPEGRPVTLTVAPLPDGATFVQEPADPQFPGLARATFSWTPSTGHAGEYLLVYTARDGSLTTSRSAKIVVQMPSAPRAPALLSPASGTRVEIGKPPLIVDAGNGGNDPTTHVEFQIYSDRAMTQLVASGSVAKGTTVGAAGTTSFTPANVLSDNVIYWWRARGYDANQVYSAWTAGWFHMNRSNDPPNGFNLTSPAAGIEVTSLQPVLTWMNTADRDGDAISYNVYVYSVSSGGQVVFYDIREPLVSQVVASAEGLTPGPDGMTRWTVNVPLTDLLPYTWQVVAVDEHGAKATSAIWTFTVNTANAPPPTPTIVSPANDVIVTTTTAALTVNKKVEPDGDPITYIFEMDTVQTFNSGKKATSSAIAQSTAATTKWTVSVPIQNQRYWWRVKAQDGKAESPWSVASFIRSTSNDPPPVPTTFNPGPGSWVGTKWPTLQANPVEDPEGNAVEYEFEIRREGTLVSSGTASTPVWTVPAEDALTDQTLHTWRVRAKDSLGAASAWSVPSNVYVATGNYQGPTIQLTTPRQPAQAEAVGAARTIEIRWLGSDPNMPASVALYHSAGPDTYVGTLIADNISQPRGNLEGSYVWDVSGLAPGTYYIYGVISDSTSSGQAYAPGPLVMPSVPQLGGIVVTAADDLHTSEQDAITVAGITVKGPATFSVRLERAPQSDVTIPLYSSEPFEGRANPEVLTFTPQNWNVDQTVTVTGMDDCLYDGDRRYQINVGLAVSQDAQYAGVAGNPVRIINDEDAWDHFGTTNSGMYGICNYAVVSRTVGSNYIEYVLTARLTNFSQTHGGFRANLRQRTMIIGQNTGNTPLRIMEDRLDFGAAAPGESVDSADAFRVRLSGPDLKPLSPDAETDPNETLLYYYLERTHYWVVTPQ